MEKSGYVLKDSSTNGRQHNLRRKLLELEEEKNTIFEESSDAIFVVDTISGEIFEANGKAAAMAGYSLSELRGMHCKHIFSKQGTSSKCHPLNGKQQCRAILRRQDGVSIRVNMRICSIPRSQKSVRLVFVRRDDISRLKSDGHLSSQELSMSTADEGEPIYEFPNLIGKSEKIRKICQLIGQVAKTDSTVLIQGESGTGKEIIAQAIHFHSNRSKGPFVKVNCAALSENLLESELFGHVKGAFTGAIRDYKGRFGQADGGTILLDEINCMSLSGQAKFLRVLQEREFEPVGSSSTATVNVRVLVAINDNLEKAVAEGKFREDLYYRLNVFPIFVTPLRERKEDIPLLTHHFLKKYNLAVGKKIQSLSPEAFALMMQYDWPGNVRELENAVEHAIIVGQGPVMLPSHLPSNLTTDTTVTENTNGSAVPGLRNKLNLFEKQIILDALTHANGIKKQAAAMLQIDPRNFPYLLRKHNLS